MTTAAWTAIFIMVPTIAVSTAVVVLIDGITDKVIEQTIKEQREKEND